MKKLTIDFETRSEVDIRETGVHVYAEHESTDVFCLAVKAGCEQARIWINARFDYQPPVPRYSREQVIALVEQADIVEAHNAGFEIAIWRGIMVNRYGWPDIPDHKWRCSAAKAAAHALPRSLEGAGAAMRLPTQKDKGGHALMMKMCKPRKPRKGEAPGLYWHEDPEDLLRLFRYCIQDAETEHALSNRLPELHPTEQRVWHLDQKMNTRGILADVELAKDIIEMAKAHEERLTEELKAITAGAIESISQVAKVAEFCGLPDVRSDTVAAALEAGNLESGVRRVLEIRQSLGRSSVAKYRGILDRACADGRIRGELLYHGASTGRWTGRGVQLQNLPRAGLKEAFVPLAISTVRDADPVWVDNLFGDPMNLAKSLIRSTFMAAPGWELIAADYAQIEARVLLWYAGEEEGLELFRSGADIYCDMASTIYDREITKKDKLERQVGKTAILGLGFGMGGSKFRSTCLTNAGVEIDKKFSRKVVKAYRERFAGVPATWYGTEKAAVTALKSKDPVVFGRNTWRKNGVFLQCQLPSGRCLSYPFPAIEIVPAWIYPAVDEEQKETSVMVIAKTKDAAQKQAMKRAEDDDVSIIGPPIEREKSVLTFMAHVKGQWVRETTYGGKLVENIVQGTARDVMAAGLLRLKDAGYQPILSVHDEVISEIPRGWGSLEEFERILATPPPWAEGLPIAAEGWRGKRYRK